MSVQTPTLGVLSASAVDPPKSSRAWQCVIIALELSPKPFLSNAKRFLLDAPTDPVEKELINALRANSPRLGDGVVGAGSGECHLEMIELENLDLSKVKAGCIVIACVKLI